MPEASNRLQREIDEILSKGKSFPAPSPTDDPEAHRQPHRLSERSAVKMLGLSFGLMLVGALCDDVLPFAGVWLVLAGVLLFVTSFAFVVFGHRGDVRIRPFSSLRERPMRRWW